MTSPRPRLSQVDVDRLLSNPSEDERARVARKVGQEMDITSLSASEKELAESILRLMVKDAAERVRRALSESLANSAEVPRDVAMALAEDLDTIALPMLENSPVFTDEDLIEIIARGEGAKQVAIAGRPSVSDQVASVLVDTDNTQAAATLAANEGADMSAQTLDRMIARHGESDEVQGALANRSDLPLTVAERLVYRVSSKWRAELLERHEIKSGTAERLMRSGREKATADLVDVAAHADDVSALAKQLHENDRLTPSLVLRVISCGDIRFFEAALAELAGVDLSKARVLVHDDGPLGLQALLGRTQIPRVYYPAITVAVKVFRETEYDGGDGDEERFRARMIERILTQYEDIEAGDLDYLLGALDDLAWKPKAA